MDDEKKQSRWVKTLDQAGLLDDIEQGWTLSGEADEPGASISVEGSGGKTIPPPAEPSVPPAADRPITMKQGAIDIAIVSDAQTAEKKERRRGSDPGPPATPASDSKPPIAVKAARATQSGLPRVSRIPPPPTAPQRRSKPVQAAASSPPAAPEPARAADRETAGPPRERVARGKARISVAPGDDWRERPDSLVPIIDEGPAGSRTRRRASRPPKAPDDRRARMEERMAIGDYSGALSAAEEILAGAERDAEATRVREECRRILIGMYEARIGPFDRVPRMLIRPHELIWRNLDAATGFVVSRVDGMSSFDDIIDVSGMPRFETCRILSQLLNDGIIG